MQEGFLICISPVVLQTLHCVTQAMLMSELNDENCNAVYIVDLLDFSVDNRCVLLVGARGLLLNRLRVFSIQAYHKTNLNAPNMICMVK